MESTHPGSDDALGPAFPDGVYGSRADPHYSPRGIYYKPKAKDGKAGPQVRTGLCRLSFSDLTSRHVLRNFLAAVRSLRNKSQRS